MMNKIEDILAEYKPLWWENPALDELIKIPKFVITGGVHCVPKLTAFIHKTTGVGEIGIYKYDRPLLDMFCKVIEENYDLPEMIIFEDDACIVSTQSLVQCDQSIKGLKNQTAYEWDLLYLGGNLLGNRINKLSDDIWIPLDGVYTTHAILFKKSSYDYMLSWKQHRDRLKDEYNGGHASDHWIYVSPLKKMITNPMYFTQLDVCGHADGITGLYNILSKSYQNRCHQNIVPWK